MKQPPSFQLGRLVATATALKALHLADIESALLRHASGDWGNLCEEDRTTNDDALKTGGRLLSAHIDSQGIRFWIITEADRSATTVLLPDDY